MLHDHRAEETAQWLGVLVLTEGLALVPSAYMVANSYGKSKTAPFPKWLQWVAGYKELLWKMLHFQSDL